MRDSASVVLPKGQHHYWAVNEPKERSGKIQASEQKMKSQKVRVPQNHPLHSLLYS
jgi:hypothetical protein